MQKVRKPVFLSKMYKFQSNKLILATEKYGKQNKSFK